MRFDVFSLFPEIFQPYLEISILKRAIQNRLIDIQTHTIRDWATDKHHTTDDTPYGGGGGMVMKPEPVFAAVESVLGAPPTCPVILLCPQGKRFDQKMARELAGYDQLGLICGRYEAFDERIRQHLATHIVSIGDFVLTGGELPALILMDAVGRLVPGVLGDDDATQDDSFSTDGLLEYPQWTKPLEFRGWTVPEIMQNGNLGLQLKWKRQQSIIRTLENRPDLLRNAHLSEEELEFINRYINQKLEEDQSSEEI